MSMSTRVTDFDPHVFEVALANLERVRDAKSDPSRSKGKTGPETTDRVEANTGHTGLFGKLGRAVVRAYYRFVERTPPVQTSKLEVIREEARRPHSDRAPRLSGFSVSNEACHGRGD